LAVIKGSYEECGKWAEEVFYSNIQLPRLVQMWGYTQKKRKKKKGSTSRKKTRITKSRGKVRILKGGKGEP